MSLRFSRFRRIAAVAAAALTVGLTAVSSAQAGPVRHENLSCLTPDAIAAVKKQPTVAFGALYDGCVGEFRAKLGPEFADLGDDALRYAFASVVAYYSAEYGAFGDYSLDGLVRAWALDCATYVALTWHLARVSGANVTYAHPVGWDGAGVGNHAQMAYERPGQQLILDPTIGLVARAALSDLFNGAAVAPERMVSFAKAQGDHPEFRVMVIDSLYRGMFSEAASIYLHPYPPGQGREYAEAAGRPDNTAPAPGSQPPAPPVQEQPAPPVAQPAPPVQAPASKPTRNRPTAAQRRAAKRRAAKRRAARQRAAKRQAARRDAARRNARR